MYVCRYVCMHVCQPDEHCRDAINTSCTEGERERERWNLHSMMHGIVFWDIRLSTICITVSSPTYCTGTQYSKLSNGFTCNVVPFRVIT